MRRNLIFLLFTLAPNLMVSALDQTFLEPAVPVIPALKAQGGASTANASGTDALFVNPSAFATDTPSLKILSIEGAANIPLNSLSDLVAQRNNWTNLNILQAGNPMVTLVNNMLTRSSVGAEASISSGWVGDNFGVGLAYQARSSATGMTLLGASETLDTTMQAVIGMAWPFDVTLGTLRLGADVRPMQRSIANLPVTTIINNMGDLSAYTVNSGFGMGWDLGARWDYGEFKTGLVIRDVGSTVINFQQVTASQWINAGGFPTSGTTSGTTLYRIPTVIGLGTAWTPDLGSVLAIVRPTLDLDFQIPIEDKYTQPSFWTWTHFGGEVLLLKSLAVRAGLNQGYFTFGLGTKVLFMDFDMAIYTDETGQYAGQSPRSAVAIQLSFQI